MNKRRQVQEKHEIFLVDAFIAWWESQSGENLRVICRPHPQAPEAIVQSDLRTTWIEVTDSFFSEAWARDLYSYATPEEVHKPSGAGPYMDMDEKMAVHFAARLKTNSQKRAMQRFTRTTVLAFSSLECKVHGLMLKPAI